MNQNLRDLLLKLEEDYERFTQNKSLLDEIVATFSFYMVLCKPKIN